MKHYIYLILIFTCLASCTYNQIVDARIDKVFYSRFGSKGYVLKYKISYIIDGKRDTSVLIGNQINEKGTNRIFYFVVGDSIKVKPARTYGLSSFNKFKGIKSLVEREKEIEMVEMQKETTEKVMSINHIDKQPLLPGALNNEDNQRLIKQFFNQKIVQNNIMISQPIVFYIKIDTQGKSHLHKVYSEDSTAIDLINAIVAELPYFSPGIKDNTPVNVITSYEVNRK